MQSTLTSKTFSVHSPGFLGLLSKSSNEPVSFSDLKYLFYFVIPPKMNYYYILICAAERVYLQFAFKRLSTQLRSTS